MRSYLMLVVASLLLLGGTAQADESLEEMQALQAAIMQTESDLQYLVMEAKETEDLAKRRELEGQVVALHERMAQYREKLEMLRLERVERAQELGKDGEVTYHRAREAFEKAMAAREALKMARAELQAGGQEAEIERVENEARVVEAAVARYQRAMDLIEEAQARAKGDRLDAAQEAIEAARKALDTIDVHIEIEQECHPTENVEDGEARWPSVNEHMQRLREMAVQLEEARTRLTERHPEVIRLREQIEALRPRLRVVPPPVFKTQRARLDAGATFREWTGPAGGREAEGAAAHARLEHLREAAHHLHEAGEHEGAERIEQEIRRIEEHLAHMERERGEHPVPEGIHPAVLEAIEGLRQEVRELRKEVREIKEILQERRAR